jgi:hypothetical protein
MAHAARFTTNILQLRYSSAMSSAIVVPSRNFMGSAAISIADGARFFSVFIEVTEGAADCFVSEQLTIVLTHRYTLP